MTGVLLGLVGIAYIGTAINYFMTGHPGLGLAFLFYAGANIGLYIEGSL